jgi:YhcH/YjgK/YiaL family protein
MISSTLARVNNEQKLYPKAIRVALNFLVETDFESLQDGRYEIQGDQLFVILGKMEAKPLEETRPEAHNDFLDIQCLLKGRETIGFAQRRKGIQPVEDLLAEKDICFYGQDLQGESFLALEADDFAIFFPDDIHRPLVKRGDLDFVRKAVVKIHMDLLAEK